jgi:hypothetical protein
VAVDAETLGTHSINAGGIGVGSSHSWSPGAPWQMHLMWRGEVSVSYSKKLSYYVEAV